MKTILALVMILTAFLLFGAACAFIAYLYTIMDNDNNQFNSK